MSRIAIFGAFCIALLLAHAPFARAAGLGVNFGLGLPTTANFGAILQFSDYVGLDVVHGEGAFERTCSDLKLSITQATLNIHPFGGAFYVGLGAGSERLTVTNTYTPTNEEFTIKVAATLAVAKMGWMWGLQDSGFWFGMDFSYYKSLSSKRDINAPGVDPDSKDYTDSLEPAEHFGDKSFIGLTFARFGWAF